MNCKPGQLAMIVRGCPRHSCIAEKIGRPVRVVHVVDGLAGALFDFVLGVGPVWVLEQPLSCPRQRPCGHGLRAIPDSCLKPLPDGEESTVDEAIVQKPAATVPHG